MIVKYIFRNRKGQRRRIGVLVGATIQGQIVIGYSMCHPDDNFDKEKGLLIARQRALSPKYQMCPPSIETDAVEFLERCMRYFKDAHCIYTGE